MLGKTNPPGTQPREQWAKAVAKDMLKSSPSRYVRRGYLATIMALVDWYAPRWLLDYSYGWSAGIPKLKAMLQSGDDLKVR